LTITAIDASKVYGAPLPALTLQYAGFVNGDSTASLTSAASAVSLASPASRVGTYPITVSGAVAANYTFVYVSGTLHVSPAPLTITANNQTMIAGGKVPTLTMQYGGFVNGDTSASLTAPATATTTATSASRPGRYPITPSGAVDPNYSITYVSGTLTIVQPSVAISAPKQVRPIGLVVSFKNQPITVASANPRALLQVTLVSTAGNLHIGAGGITAKGNGTRKLILTGNQTSLNKALRTLVLTLASKRASGTLTITLADAQRHLAQQGIKVL
jgi:hypothetical protein